MDRRVKRRVENPCEVFQVSLKWRMFPRFCSVRCVNSSFFLFFQFFFFFLLYIQLVDSSSFFFVLHLRYGLKLLFFGIPYVLKRDACLIHHVWILRLTIDRTARIIRGLLATCEETVNETTNFFFFPLCHWCDHRTNVSRSMIAKNYIIDIFTVFYMYIYIYIYPN